MRLMHARIWIIRTETKPRRHNRLKLGALLSNDRLASSVARNGSVRLTLAYMMGREVSAAGVHHRGLMGCGGNSGGGLGAAKVVGGYWLAGGPAALNDVQG